MDLIRSEVVVISILCFSLALTGVFVVAIHWSLVYPNLIADAAIAFDDWLREKFRGFSP